MSKAAAFAVEIASLLYLRKLPAWHDAASLYVAVHSADPRAGDQSTAELADDGRDRTAIPRDGLRWEIDSNAARNRRQIDCRRTTAKVTRFASHFSIGLAENGSGRILYCGPCSNPSELKIDHYVAFSPTHLAIIEP